MADGSMSTGRYDSARADAAERATLTVAVCQAEIARQTVARAAALMDAAIAFGPSERRRVRLEVSAALREALGDLAEIVREIEA